LLGVEGAKEKKLRAITRDWPRAKNNKTMADLVAAAKLCGCRIVDTKEGKMFWPPFTDINPVPVPQPHPQKEVLTAYVSKFIAMVEAILWKIEDANGENDDE
jgi:hypothetical protein